MNLREAVLQRIKGRTEEDIHMIIEDSIGGAEMALPGLGVLFEVVWDNVTPDDRDKMAAILQLHANGQGEAALSSQ